MQIAVLTVRIQTSQSLVMLRHRCRQVGELFGLEALQRTRLTTAVSEIGRNALQHAGEGYVPTAEDIEFLAADTNSTPEAVEKIVAGIKEG